MRIVSMADLAPQERHELLARLVSPHSTAVVSTLDAAGEPLVAPLGHCVPLRGRQATVAVTIAAVRDAGGEPELVRAAALAAGELVANLTATAVPDHLAELAKAPREPATGALRWPIGPSARVAVPSLSTSRARLECRVLEPAAQDGPAPDSAVAVRDRTGGGGDSRRPTGYVVIAEVLCVVADDDLLAPGVAVPEQRAAQHAGFPWFFGPSDGSVVEGHPVIEQQAIER